MRSGRGNIADTARIVKLRTHGLTIPEIAKALDIAPRTAHRHLKAAGMTRPAARPFILTPEARAIAEQLAAEGASIVAISQHLGISNTTAARYFPGAAWTPTQVGSHGAATKKANERLRRLGHGPMELAAT